MGKIGVDLQEWQTTVDRNQAALGRVNSLKQVKLKQTDLKQFRNVDQTIERFNKALNALKDQTAAETRQLIQLGLNKQNDDAQYGK
ncbi:MAG: hypothetical protein MRZ40_06335 [Ligilactobacillus animalis]|uniref:hypothetical protein n=1 Tax=Ligilactobacillus animalis TaxID=1605 RepID=UPI00243202F5|nr:hypothetical protein [Ligilactobacillus animalis]MCI5942173.1 hypothetical protein [Ligilactobacillus animalis]MDY2992077.1 hypothetical protein [Ligilactobacillus animalis]